jgi:molybdenum cofactor cytidylyltransferase
MSYRVNHCGIVILAAGQSKRLGSPKQLLPFADRSLLSHSVDVALSTGCSPVIVVVGANKETVVADIAGKNVQVVENESWQEGMASSLRIGLQHIQQLAPQHDGIIFMVCDQPFVTKSLLDCLITTQQSTGKAATASSYAGKLGTPALFHQTLWPQLQQLQGDTGARKLLMANPDEVAAVPFEAGATDIDTKEDYERLINSQNANA